MILKHFIWWICEDYSGNKSVYLYVMWTN